MIVFGMVFFMESSMEAGMKSLSLVFPRPMLIGWE